jgi:hypothetical protein
MVYMSHWKKEEHDAENTGPVSPDRDINVEDDN